MGLDMYLSAKRYIWFNEQTTKNSIKALDIPGIDTLDPKEISCSAVYWRKANQIHRWFVVNVQNLKDECEEYDVSLDQLKSLLADCQAAKANPDQAAEILPPYPGFFFGSTAIDEFYWQDIDETISELEKIINNPAFQEGWEFTYRSSW